MRSNGISSDDQPTQEISQKEQATLPMAVGQQTALSVGIALQNPEQQPTQEINPVHQATLPEVVEQKIQEKLLSQQMELERQATLPMVVERQDLDQPPVMSNAVPQNEDRQRLLLRGKQQQRSSNRALWWWVSLVVFTFLLVGVVIGGSVIEGWFSQNFSRNESPTHVVGLNNPFSTPTQPSMMDITAKLFMDAMMHKDWAAMWPMLSPDAQQLWQGEKDFIHFEKAKFGSLIFTSFSDSSAQMQYNWRDPDTTQIYAEVATLRVSLEASGPNDLLSVPSNLALSKGLFNNSLFALEHYQNNWRVLVAGPADPNAPILVPASLPVTKLLVPIFMYHHVSNLPVRDYLDFGLTVTTINFNAQLDWFRQHGYHSITQTELFDALYYGKALPGHPMILTFDDGYKDMYTDALPALLAHHYRGVFYIITGFTGGNYMTWQQVRTLAQEGMQIASHTIHHVNIGQPPAWTSTQKELLLSKETLETQLGYPIQFFCYPTGEPFHRDSIYEQQIVLADLFTDGYVGATLDPFAYDSAIQNAQTPYQLPRIRVSGGEGLQLFISILNSTLNIDAYRLANGLAY
jgi:peptidoglycan/xylan/chitin deacetylase (PgdA/CDA1 family)